MKIILSFKPSKGIGGEGGKGKGAKGPLSPFSNHHIFKGELKMPYSSEPYLNIFDRDIDDDREEQIESLRKRKALFYRVKTIKSGDMLECEIYPIWIQRYEASRAKRVSKTRLAQRNLNDKNAKKLIIRIINTNFTADDLAVDLTYRGDLPNEDQARRDIQNYIRRIKDYRRKHGLPELKYVYVIEFDDTEGGRKRIHHHMIMNSMDRDVLEKLWGKGYANSRRLQPNEFGLEGIARYMTKDPRGTKRWSASRNLESPKVTIADHKVTKRRVEKIARYEDTAQDIFQKLYPGYAFNDIKIKYSDFVSGAYLYVRMRKSGAQKTNKFMQWLRLEEEHAGEKDGLFGRKNFRRPVLQE